MVIVKLSNVSFVQYWAVSDCLLLQHNYSLLLLCLSFLICKMGVAGNKNRKHVSIFTCGASSHFLLRKLLASFAWVLPFHYYVDRDHQVLRKQLANEANIGILGDKEKMGK